MRVLYINDLEWCGGTEVFIHQLAECMRGDGHEVYLAFGKVTSNYGCYHIRCKRRIWYSIIDPIVYEQVNEIFNQIKPDLIHLNNLTLPCLTLAPLLAARTRGIPRIITIHDYWPVCPRRNLLANTTICADYDWKRCFSCVGVDSQKWWMRVMAKYLPWLGNRLLEKRMKETRKHLKGETIVCASNVVKDSLLRFGYNSPKIHVIPYGVDIDMFKPANKKEKGVLWVGRVEPVKGPEYFMRAAEIVKEEHPDAGFTIVGGPPYRGMYVSSAVNVAGKVHHEKLLDYYSKALLVVMTSVWPEPFGIVALEAMACGKPVVAFASGGIQEIITDGINGLLVEPKNYNRLAEKISYLLNNPDVAIEMGEKARKTIESKYSLKSVAELYKTMYINVLQVGEA